MTIPTNQDVKYWKLDGLNVYKLLKPNNGSNNVLLDCLEIQSGLSKIVKLKNINGKYLLSDQTYNDSPVFINSAQTLFFVGPNIDIGTELDSVDPFFFNSVVEDSRYSIVRDGPYLLGKFGPNNTWAIIELPDASDNIQYVDVATINVMETVVNTIDNIILSQVNTKPPLILQDYIKEENKKNKKYLAWKNSVSPLSRPWAINKKVCKIIDCDPESGIEPANYRPEHIFSTSLSTITDTSNPDEYKPQSVSYNAITSTPFDERVYSEFVSLRSELLSSYGVNVAPILTDFDFTMTLGEYQDWNVGIFTDLGSIRIDEELKTILKVDVKGSFTNISNIRSIIYGGKYIIDNIQIYISEDGEPVSINGKDLKRLVNPQLYSLLIHIRNILTAWCRKTAFLFGPPLLSQVWLSKALVFYLSADISAEFMYSKLTSKYYFYNYIDMELYDRMYQFMRLKGI